VWWVGFVGFGWGLWKMEEVGFVVVVVVVVFIIGYLWGGGSCCV